MTQPTAGTAGTTGTAAPKSASTHRLGYIDWLRGLAVLIMIEAHVFDSWTQPSDRALPLFGHLMVLGGFGAPLFLFLAGLSVVLAGEARSRRTGDVGRAAASVQRRGWEIFGLAFLFRLQSFVLNPGAPVIGLLKVDILNIMGPGIAGAAWMWGRLRDNRWRAATFLAITLALAFATPIVRDAAWLSWLPDPIEAYLRPAPGRSTFTFFPWVGFVFAGALLGIAVASGRRGAERLTHGRIAAAGAAIAIASYAASYLPSPYAHSSFWTSSPAFFFLRTGILALGFALVFFWHQRGPWTALGRYAPMQRFGRSSLLVYWIHVEMVYGWLTLPLHKRLPLPWAIAAYAAFTLVLFGIVVVKQGIVEARKRKGSSRSPVSSLG